MMMVWINACMNKPPGRVSFLLLSFFFLLSAYKTFQQQLRWMDISSRRSVFSSESCLCWSHAAAGQCGGKKEKTTLVNVLVFMWIFSAFILYLSVKCSLCFRWFLLQHLCVETKVWLESMGGWGKFIIMVKQWKCECRPYSMKQEPGTVLLNSGTPILHPDLHLNILTALILYDYHVFM